MPVYEVIVSKGAKPRLIKAKTQAGAIRHAAESMEIFRPSAERMHVLAARGTKIEFVDGVQAEPQRDIEEPKE